MSDAPPPPRRRKFDWSAFWDGFFSAPSMFQMVKMNGWYHWAGIAEIFLLGMIAGILLDGWAH